eukprot:g5762.t1
MVQRDVRKASFANLQPRTDAGAAAAAAAIAAAATSGVAPAHDTAGLIGSAYTPWRAPNQLWWLNLTDHKADIERELRAMRSRLGFTAVRVFLHDHLWEVRGAALTDTIGQFLALADAQGIRAGFVFFDDCWQHNANLSAACVPKQGVHNGCWLAAPQDSRRGNGTAPFESYVRGVVRAFRNDPRVAWWEIFNEPQRKNPFSLALRDAAYRWAKAEAPTAPVMSCWDDSNNTDVVDHHQYYVPSYPNFLSNAVFQNPAKGGLVTEAGCRWYQGSPQDAGSPLVTVGWLEGLRRAGSGAPFVPGVMLSWEAMVGHSMTRWHWGTPESAAEPAVPWCGSLYPDGTPVSYTEAAALRRYASGGASDDFLFLATFQNVSAGAAAPEAVLRLHPSWDCTVGEDYGCFDDHRRILPAPVGNEEDMSHAVCGALCHDSGYELAGVEYADQCWCGHALPSGAAPVNASSCSMPCAGAPAERCGAPYTIGVFAPACKPAAPAPGRPDATRWAGWTPPRAPAEALYELAVWPEMALGALRISAGSYNVTLAFGAGPGARPAQASPSPSAMTLDAGGAALAAANVSARLVVGGWNIVRVLCEQGRARVWLNPSFADVTGASAPPADLARAPAAPRALIDVAAPAAAPAPAGLSVVAPRGAWRVDYASVLPPTL